jgi:hypothetical protein
MSEPRKSPYEHPVNPTHKRFSAKVRREGFKRGKGKAPRKKKQVVRKLGGVMGDPSGFNVSIFFDNAPRETVNVGENDYTSGTKAGLTAMRTPAIPVRMQIRRRKK